MRQRLGIAQTLIGHPEVLILDEPANGLDPEGIAWMRELLRDFADQGGTVLLSSHLLAEVEATVDRLVVRAGQVVADGRLADLLSTTVGGPRHRPHRAPRRTHRRRHAVHRPTTTAPSPSTPPVGSPPNSGIGGRPSGVLLVELRAADRTGLEQLFFALTTSSDTDADLEEVSR